MTEQEIIAAGALSCRLKVTFSRACQLLCFAGGDPEKAAAIHLEQVAINGPAAREGIIDGLGAGEEGGAA